MMKTSILLVDDVPENLVALEAILGQLDLEIIKANSGSEALRHLLQLSEAADAGSRRAVAAAETLHGVGDVEDGPKRRAAYPVDEEAAQGDDEHREAHAAEVGRVVDAVGELNLAARFGRMDLAASRTHRAARSSFIERHASWGGGVHRASKTRPSLHHAQ